MAQVSEKVYHDYIELHVTFPNKVKANVTFSRNGETVSVRPSDPARAERLSNIATQCVGRLRAKKKGLDPEYPFDNHGQVVAQMKTIAEAAKTIDQYLDGLARVLMVSGERPKPAAAADAPSETAVTVKPNRGGWSVSALFPNGETFGLRIGKSASWTANPAISSRDRDVSRAMFNYKETGGMSEQELAELIAEKARDNLSIDDWFTEMQAAFAPGLRR